MIAVWRLGGKPPEPITRDRMLLSDRLLLLACWRPRMNVGRPTLLCRRIADTKVVGDRENIGDAIGANIGSVLIGLIVNHAFESDVAALPDDVNGGNGLEV